MGTETTLHAFAFRDLLPLVALALFALFLWRDKLPSIATVQQFVGIANGRGGNIVVLVGFSVWFFHTAMGFFYRTLEMIAAKQLDVQNAVLMMALQFVMGTAFGGAFAALLKTMTGSDSGARATDVTAANGKTHVATTLTQTTVSDTPASNGKNEEGK